MQLAMLGSPLENSHDLLWNANAHLLVAHPKVFDRYQEIAYCPVVTRGVPRSIVGGPNGTKRGGLYECGYSIFNLPHG
jgi:hypothetical protein